MSLNTLGLIGLRRRRLDEARTYFEQAGVIFAELGDRRWEALIRSNLAETLLDMGRRPEAKQALQKVIDAPFDPEWTPEDREWKAKAREALAKLK